MNDRPKDSAKWRRERDGQNWRWVWNGWRSASFPYLEQRPWTPCVIANRLCFVASDVDHDTPCIDQCAFDRARWRIVWGDQSGPWFDDVHSLAEYKGKPIYIARIDGGNGSSNILVWGDQRSQSFSSRIGYRLHGEHLAVEEFDSATSAAAPLSPIWRPLSETIDVAPGQS